MSVKIYTKTGDSGTTSLIGGTKVSKADLRIEAYGTVDELNAFIGLTRDLLTMDKELTVLSEIQDRLFTIGSALAVDPGKQTGLQLPDLQEADIVFLEKEIDRMNDLLPPMKHFVLPGGDPIISNIHISRCVCRRAERCCVRLTETSATGYPVIIKYLNRLSDYLFMLSRYVALQLNVAEIPWKPRINK
jgi:cob(I)alamin adenosyltransferase